MLIEEFYMGMVNTEAKQLLTEIEFLKSHIHDISALCAEAKVEDIKRRTEDLENLNASVDGILEMLKSIREYKNTEYLYGSPKTNIKNAVEKIFKLDELAPKVESYLWDEWCKAPRVFTKEDFVLYLWEGLEPFCSFGEIDLLKDEKLCKGFSKLTSPEFDWTSLGVPV